MKVRAARPEDLPELERLRRAMPYPGSLFLEEADYLERALERLRDALPRLAELPDVRLLVLTEGEGLSGYLFLEVDDVHGVTQQLQAVLLDFAVFEFAGLAKLMVRARKIVNAFENEYLVVDLSAQDRRTQLWFYRCGFRGEQTRVVKYLPAGFQGAASADYPIRQARPDDLPFLLEVHAAFTRAYRPAGREVDLQALESSYQMSYLLLDLSSPLYFVIEERASGKRAGYLLLNLGEPVAGKKTFYVYDVAIAPEFSGRGLSVFLQGKAESIAGVEGGFVYGDGSLEVASLASWHTQMGYPVDTIRFSLECRELPKSRCP
ncbi:MAG: hypothetical protein J0I12_13340 [Candidatus Eremiobacteraeota bacterium]|nr:hypothetical protein [Candidatus Eremiobacteraeota bacterium]